jgi:hypothetical protein
VTVVVNQTCPSARVASLIAQCRDLGGVSLVSCPAVLPCTTDIALPSQCTTPATLVLQGTQCCCADSESASVPAEQGHRVHAHAAGAGRLPQGAPPQPPPRQHPAPRSRGQAHVLNCDVFCQCGLSLGRASLGEHLFTFCNHRGLFWRVWARLTEQPSTHRYHAVPRGQWPAMLCVCIACSLGVHEGELTAQVPDVRQCACCRLHPSRWRSWRRSCLMPPTPCRYTALRRQDDSFRLFSTHSLRGWYCCAAKSDVPWSLEHVSRLC